VKCVSGKLLILDLFGSPYFFNISQNKTVFNTKLGGLYSIVLIIAALTFAIMRLTAWFKRETPQVTTQY
jgi:hypothetical protein